MSKLIFRPVKNRQQKLSVRFDQFEPNRRKKYWVVSSNFAYVREFFGKKMRVVVKNLGGNNPNMEKVVVGVILGRFWKIHHRFLGFFLTLSC